jgi:hypothetical protein
MNLDTFIAELQKLQAEGHGQLPVFYRHGASGDCGELSSAHVTNEIEDTGPFDLPYPGNYVSVYAGI